MIENANPSSFNNDKSLCFKPSFPSFRTSDGPAHGLSSETSMSHSCSSCLPIESFVAESFVATNE
jgi:hypothetical protein